MAPPAASSSSSSFSRGTGANSGPLGGVAGLDDDDSQDEDAFLQSLGLKQNIKKGAKVALSASSAVAGGSKKKGANAAKEKNVVGGGSFQSMALSPNLLKSLLHRGFTTPTPIQRAALPSALTGRDIVGMARTGSGKTLAYMVPLIQKLGAVHSPRYGARALVLVPTRELALQVLKVGKDIARGATSRSHAPSNSNGADNNEAGPSSRHSHGNTEQLRWGLVVGGDSLEEQYALMASNPDILIATPGRLLHLLVEMSADLRSVEFLVFDEADRLFELGFETSLTEIISKLSPTRQTLLFSATLPKSLVEFAKAGLQNPKLVRLDTESKISSDLQMAFISIKPKEKESALLLLLRDIIETPLAVELPSYGELASDEEGDNDDAASRFRKRKRDTKFAGGGTRNTFNNKNKGKRSNGSNHNGLSDLSGSQSIVFAATKHHVEYLSTMLVTAGYAVSSIYGAMDQVARLSQLGRFRAGKTSVMVVTDLAARGIDIPLLPNVINYDFPTSARTFVHRVGRTARAGRKGWAYSFVTNSELPHLFDLQLFLGRPLIPAPTSTDDFANNLVLGTVPRDRLDLDSDHFRSNILEPSSTLMSLLGVAEKGQKMYEKSQGKASQESYRRTKELISGSKGLAGSEREEDGIHPIFTKLVQFTPSSAIASSSTSKTASSLAAAATSASSVNGVSRSDLLAQLNSFRPPETVLEIGNRGKTAAAQIMQKRRASLGKAKARKIGAAQQPNGDEAVGSAPEEEVEDSIVDASGNMGELADEDDLEEAFHTNGRTSAKKQKDFRDPSVYLGYVQEGADAEKGYSLGGESFAAQAASSAYDLVAATDEMDGRLAPQKASMLRWDRKHKKFVKGDGTGSDNKKLIRTESGGKLPASFKSGSFDDWKKKQKVFMPKVGDAELKNRQMPNSGPGGVGKRWRHTGVVAARGAGDKPRRDGKGGFVKDFSNNKKKKSAYSGGGGGDEDAGGKTRSSTSQKVRGSKGSGSQLKSVDQIRKDRLLKAKRVKRSNQPGNKRKKK